MYFQKLFDLQISALDDGDVAEIRAAADEILATMEDQYRLQLSKCSEEYHQESQKQELNLYRFLKVCDAAASDCRS